MAKQILSEEFRRMQKLAGIITEEQLNEVQSSYSVELLVPKVYFNVETGELSGNKYEWYSERELRAGADQTSYTNGEELDTVVFSNDYNTAMDFSSEYPELLKVVSLNEQLNEKQSNYSIELLVPKVYFNVETGELSDNKYEWYTEKELRAGADQTSYADPKELDTVVFSNDYGTAMDFASEYPELLKVV